jgi:PAS domain S-box-containing protein
MHPPRTDPVRRLHAQYEVARALSECTSLADAAPRILQSVCESLGWQHGALWRVESGVRVLRCIETWHAPKDAFAAFEEASRNTVFTPGVGLPGVVWETGKPLWLPDVVPAPNFPRAAAARAEGLHGAIGVPVTVPDRTIGVLEFFSREIRQPDAELLEMLATCGSQLGQFIERVRAEAELTTLFDASPDLLCIAGLDGYFRRLNPAWERTLGHTAEELMACPYVEFVHPEDREATFAEAHKLTLGASTVSFENRYRCRDGSYRWLSWKATPLPHQGLVSAIARDVTDQRAAAEELRRAREAAEAATRARGDFLANVSHEIRTPMNAVIGMAELLLDTPLRPEQSEYLAILKDSAESLLGLINDILDFSRLERGRLELSPAEFDVRDALGDALRTLGLRAHQKGLELALRVAPNVPERVVGDAGRLRQVLVNLVGNAVKFTERGEVLVQVERAEPARGELALRFTVEDTGIGIPQDKQSQVFEAFVQADPSTTRQHGGTGLGLAISAELVRRMGGDIELESEPGRGSRFGFTVRFAVPSGGLRPTGRMPARLRGLPALVVDDNATNRRILEEVLSQWRMQPRPAASGEEALAELDSAARAGRLYRIVLLDVHMPGMDGFEVARRLRESPALARTAVLMLTSGPRASDRERCAELGIAAQLTKPVKQSDLLDRMLSLLAGAQPEEPRARELPASPGPRLRVLVAEDNAVNQRVAIGMLERAGHEAVLARNGREALARLEVESFDAVLMDVQMPEMDGLEATAAIREREKHTGGHLPILAVTAHAFRGDAERCLAAGMDAYVTKPLRPRELRVALARLVARAGRASERRGAAEPSVAVDAKRLLDRVGGSREALRELVALFRDDAPAQLGRIREAVSAGDGRALRAAAHALKGAVSNFAADAAAAAAFRLQRLAESGSTEGALPALDELERELEAVLAELDRVSRGT